jgi:hypothetical protein
LALFELLVSFVMPGNVAAKQGRSSVGKVVRLRMFQFGE